MQIKTIENHFILIRINTIFKNKTINKMSGEDMQKLEPYALSGYKVMQIAGTPWEPARHVSHGSR